MLAGAIEKTGNNNYKKHPVKSHSTLQNIMYKQMRTGTFYMLLLRDQNAVEESLRKKSHTSGKCGFGILSDAKIWEVITHSCTYIHSSNYSQTANNSVGGERVMNNLAVMREVSRDISLKLCTPFLQYLSPLVTSICKECDGSRKIIFFGFSRHIVFTVIHTYAQGSAFPDKFLFLIYR